MHTDKGRRWAVALWVYLASGILLAQPQEGQETQPQEPIPRIPRTTVLGRPEPFPSSPLDEQTLVSPFRSETPASDVASSVTVITEQQIQRRQQPSVLEVLRGVPGLDVIQQGGAGRLTSVFMRGANSQQTKVLLDGIPINDPSNATRQFDFSTLVVDGLERVEVLRGPQSMMYGSDAIGGVINIVTKRGEGPATASFRAMGGSFGTSQESFHLSGGGALAYYSLSGTYLDTSGISSAEERNGNFENDGYQNGTITGRFGWTPSEAFNVDYVFRYIDARAELDDFTFGSPPVIDNFIRFSETQAFYNRLQIQSRQLDGWLEQKLGFHLTDYIRSDIHAPPGQDPLFKGQTRGVDWQGSLLLTENNTFSVGADYWQEEAASTSEARQSQNNVGAYVQHQIRLWERVILSGGVRWDDNSGAGPATTYRATARYNVDETGTALHGSIGTGFRAPSLAEKFFAFGNPDLRPERSQGWDMGIQQELFCDHVLLDVTYFDNDFTDLVIFDLNTFTLLNVGRARASGLEVTSLFQLTDHTSASVNYTFTDTRDQITGTRLARRPLNKANLGLHHRFFDNQAEANLYLLYVDSRLDSPFSGIFLDSYITVNVTGSYWLNDCIQLFARIDNLFDEDYQEAFGFGTPGVSAYGGLTIHL